MSDTWETDFRWRLMRVSSELLSALLSGDMRANCASDAPADLAVIGLTEVQPGPHGWYEFVVWSATFDPASTDGKRPVYPFPLITCEYRP